MKFLRCTSKGLPFHGARPKHGGAVVLWRKKTTETCCWGGAKWSVKIHGTPAKPDQQKEQIWKNKTTSLFSLFYHFFLFFFFLLDGQMFLLANECHSNDQKSHPPTLQRRSSPIAAQVVGFGWLGLEANERSLFKVFFFGGGRGSSS